MNKGNKNFIKKKSKYAIKAWLSLASAISQSKSHSAMYKCICYNDMYKDTQKGANLSLQIMQFI